MKKYLISLITIFIMFVSFNIEIKAVWHEDGYLIINNDYFEDNNIDYDEFWEEFSTSSQFKKNQLVNNFTLKQSFYEYAVDLIGRDNYKDLQTLITTNLLYNPGAEVVQFIEASGRLVTNFKNWLIDDKKSGSAAYFGVDKILSGTQSGSYKSDNSSPTLTNPVNVINTYNNQKYTTETNWYYDITNNNYYTTNYNYTTQIYDNTSIVIYNYNNVEIKHMDQNGVYYDGIHYFELPDGRDSFNLTADEIKGLKLDYDISNYASLSDSERTLFLSHFDNNYIDLSSLNNEIEITNTSNTFVQSDTAFGTYMYLSDQQDHIVSFDSVVDGLDQWTVEWRDYYGEWTGRLLYSIVSGTSFVDGKGYFKSANGTYGNALLTDDIYRFGYNNTKSNINPISIIDSSNVSIVNLVLEKNTEYSISYDNKSGSSNSYRITYYYKNTWIENINNNITTQGNITFTTPNYDIDQVQIRFGNYVENVKVFSTYIDYELYSPTTNQWNYNSITYDNGYYSVYLNGQLIDEFYFDGIIQLYYDKGIDLSYQMSGAISYYLNSTSTSTSSYSYSGTIDTAYFGYNYYYLDEMRISKGVIYTGNHNIPVAPFDSNKIYVLPTNYNINHILIKSDLDPIDFQIGGIRPSDPQNSYVYISVDNSKKITSVQQFKNNNWYQIDGAIFNGRIWVDIVGTYIIYGVITEQVTDSISSDPVISQIFNTTNNFYDTLVNNFEEVTNVIYNLFVPSDEYMQEFKENEFADLKKNLGILYEPFNIIELTFGKLSSTYSPYQEVEVINEETQEVEIIQEEKIIDNKIEWGEWYVPGFDEVPLIQAGTFSFTELLNTSQPLKMVHDIYFMIVRVLMIIGFIGLSVKTFNKTIGK